MSTSLRSEGWSVQPSFVPNGATTPVTLLGDDEGLTQLAGEPAVAWQTPWSELSNVQLVRFARSVALFATAAGVRYCWRTRSLRDYDALRALVLAHGGTTSRQHRRAGVYSVAIVVLIAALAGGIGSWLYRNSSGEHELAQARAVNLTLKDLPTGWFATSDPDASALSFLFPKAGKVFRATTTPTRPPAKNSVWVKGSTVFQKCLGVSAANDRVYGRAGQQPDYQVSSPIFASPSFGGIEAVSTSQYYHTTTMVHRDVHEMSRPNFGTCFVTSSIALILGGTAPKDVATNYRPVTFVRGWSRGGEEVMTLPHVSGAPHLVMVVITEGHFEVTLGVLVTEWPKSKSFVTQLASTLLSRITSPSSNAA